VTEGRAESRWFRPGERARKPFRYKRLTAAGGLLVVQKSASGKTSVISSNPVERSRPAAGAAREALGTVVAQRLR